MHPDLLATIEHGYLNVGLDNASRVVTTTSTEDSVQSMDNALNSETHSTVSSLPATRKPSVAVTKENTLHPSKSDLTNSEHATLSTMNTTCNQEYFKTPPQPVYTVLTPTSKNSPAASLKPDHSSSVLHQLLKQKNVVTPRDFVISEIQQTSSNPTRTILMPHNKTSTTSYPVTREETVWRSEQIHNSGLTTHSAHSEIQEISPERVHAFPSTNIREINSTASIIAADKNPSPVFCLRPRSSQVKSSVPDSTANCDGHLSDVKVELVNEALWKEFHEQGNEMMVSRPGRYDTMFSSYIACF